MPIKRLDFRTRAEEKYYEHMATRGNEIKTIRQAECLWQEFVGELKTNKGECVGIGMENYGSNLKRYIGENLDILVEMEIEDIIKATSATYPTIISCTVKEVIERQEGNIHITIELDTVYGLVLKILEISRGC